MVLGIEPIVYTYRYKFENVVDTFFTKYPHPKVPDMLKVETVKKIRADAGRHTSYESLHDSEHCSLAFSQDFEK